jgi:hypothetical protein
MNPKIKALLTSRKFYATVAGIIFVLLKGYVPNFPLSEEQVMTVVGLLGAYIIGTGLDNPSGGDKPAGGVPTDGAGA